MSDLTLSQLPDPPKQKTLSVDDLPAPPEKGYGDKVGEAASNVKKAFEESSPVEKVTGTLGAAVNLVARPAASMIATGAGEFVENASGSKNAGHSVEKYINDIFAPVTKIDETTSKLASTVMEPISNLIDKGASAITSDPDKQKAIKQLVGVASMAAITHPALKGAKPTATIEDLAGTRAGFRTAKETAKKETTKAYDELEGHLPSKTTDIDLTNTQKTLTDRGIKTEVQQAVDSIRGKLSVQGEPLGSASLESVKELRTEIGKNINWGKKTPVDVKLTQIYNSLTADIEAVAKAKGPEALAAWNKANAANAAEMAMSVKKGKTLLNSEEPEAVDQIKRIVAQQGKNAPAFADEILRRAGSSGSKEWNGDVFLRNWDRMNPESRSVVFGTKGADYVTNLTKLVDDLKTAKKLISRRGITIHGHRLTGPTAATAILGMTIAAGLHQIGFAEAVGMGYPMLGAGLSLTTAFTTAGAITRALASPKMVRAMRNSLDGSIRAAGATTAVASQEPSSLTSSTIQ